MIDEFQDFSSRDGAYALIEYIRQYWRDRKLDYGLSLEPVTVQGNSGQRTVWTIKSNMLDGLPPAYYMVKSP
jgi:hypothetical protein